MTPIRELSDYWKNVTGNVVDGQYTVIDQPAPGGYVANQLRERHLNAKADR